MSYILDALKRAEKERKLGQTPAALDEIAVPEADGSQVRRRWVVIGIVAMLLTAAGVYGLVKVLHGDTAPAAVTVAVPATQFPPAAPPTPQTSPDPAVAPAPADTSSEDAAPPAAATPSRDATIEGGDAIASLDDLTEDANSAPAENDGGASPDEADLNSPPSDALADSGGAGRPLAERPAPALSQGPAAAPARPTIVRPEVRPAPAPPPGLATKPASPAPSRAAVTSSQEPAAPAVRGVLRAPPAGPLVVLGDNPHVVEAPVPTPPRPAAAPSPLGSAASANSPAAYPATESSPPAATPPADAAGTEAPSTEPPPSIETPGKKQPARAAARSERSPSAAESATAARERTDRLESLRRFKEMPPAFRAEFPPLTVDVHVYNADAQRSFVIVNGKRYHDGDVLAEGPHIVEIVSEGIVFEWRGEKVLYALNR